MEMRGGREREQKSNEEWNIFYFLVMEVCAVTGTERVLSGKDDYMVPLDLDFT